MISLCKNSENEWMEHLEALEFIIMIFFYNYVVWEVIEYYFDFIQKAIHNINRELIVKQEIEFTKLQGTLDCGINIIYIVENKHNL
jgi:hypothetical protein